MTKIARDNNDTSIQALRPFLPTTRVAISASSQEVPRVSDSTTIVRVAADTQCWVRVGKDVTPDNGAYFPAGLVEYFSLGRGQQLHVVGTSGSVYVTECS